MLAGGVGQKPGQVKGGHDKGKERGPMKKPYLQTYISEVATFLQPLYCVRPLRFKDSHAACHLSITIKNKGNIQLSLQRFSNCFHCFKKSLTKANNS